MTTHNNEHAPIAPSHDLSRDPIEWRSKSRTTDRGTELAPDRGLERTTDTSLDWTTDTSLEQVISR